MNIFNSERKSFTEIGKIYFWTATIHNWFHLLEAESKKSILTDSLSHLSSKELIDVFGFVIMPNHVHIIWRMNKMNGKERPFGSFLKYTAHEFKKLLSSSELSPFSVQRSNKNFEFWQRDSLAIELYSPEVAYQKLDYIHLNPMSKKWNLVTDPSDYLYSSAKFYETGISKFPFLKYLGEEF
ncbi:MAG: transposase [Ekhidna sp.]